MPLECFLVELVADFLEEVPQFVMALRQLFNFFQVLRHDALDVLGLELGQSGVGLERRVELAQHARVVDDVAILLVVLDAVHARDGLQQVVRLQRLVEIENRVFRRIEAGQQLVDNDQDFRVVAELERIDDGPVVVPSRRRTAPSSSSRSGRPPRAIHRRPRRSPRGRRARR